MSQSRVSAVKGSEDFNVVFIGAGNIMFGTRSYSGLYNTLNLGPTK